ncbi:hypothetical protein PENTCL1PPCAC_19748, partial [Pristionchus entomophagus]
GSFTRDQTDGKALSTFMMRILLPLILVASAQTFLVTVYNLQSNEDVPVKYWHPEIPVSEDGMWKAPADASGRAMWFVPHLGDIVYDGVIMAHNLFVQFSMENSTTIRYTVGTNYTINGSSTSLRMKFVPRDRSLPVFVCNDSVSNQCVKQGQSPADPKIVKWSRAPLKDTRNIGGFFDLYFY